MLLPAQQCLGERVTLDTVLSYHDCAYLCELNRDMSRPASVFLVPRLAVRKHCVGL